jgi:hypothetical protein
MGALMFLHTRLLETERTIIQHAITISLATKLINEMTEEQQRVGKILAAWEETEDGQEKTNSD